MLSFMLNDDEIKMINKKVNTSGPSRTIVKINEYAKKKTLTFERLFNSNFNSGV